MDFDWRVAEYIWLRRMLKLRGNKQEEEIVAIRSQDSYRMEMGFQSKQSRSRNLSNSNWLHFLGPVLLITSLPPVTANFTLNSHTIYSQVTNVVRCARCVRDQFI